MMSKMHTVNVAGEAFSARSGQVLLDAALLGGVDMPHDCRAGRCGACLTRVKQGITLGGEARQRGMVHACQARVFSDLSLEVEPLPPVARVRGKVMRTTELGKDIYEVVIAPEHPIVMLPGQYCRFAFRGFPPRPFSPTARLTNVADDGLVRLHIKRVRDGRVTSQIGETITAKHAVTIEGPFGHAFLRPQRTNRLVLVGTGTGFAPVWSLAAAALAEDPGRQIVMMAGSRKINGFYMGRALALLAEYTNVKVIAAIEELDQSLRLVSNGGLIEHLPELSSEDIVYAAGAPAMVEAFGEAAMAAGAMFYSDPFEPVAAPAETSWLETARSWLKAG